VGELAEVGGAVGPAELAVDLVPLEELSLEYGAVLPVLLTLAVL